MEKIIGQAEATRTLLREKFENLPIENLMHYASLMYKVESEGQLKEVWTKALQRAIDLNERVYIPSGTYYIDQSIILPSNRQIIAAEDANICILKGVTVLLMRNADVIDGSHRVVGMDEPHTENICIEGGIWSEEQTERHGFGETGRFDEENSYVGVTACLLFSGVKNLSLYNMKFIHTAGFAIEIGRCENFYIEKMMFEECFADGVHINGQVKNGVVTDISGHTEDDLVALNAWDWEISTINPGPIENLVVKNIFAPKEGNCCRAMRIMPGVLPIEGGEIDCYIKNLHVKNTKGIYMFKMYLQTLPYMEKPSGGKVGRFDSIYFEDIEFDLKVPTDCLHNFLNCDPVTGNFGVFEIGSNVSYMSLKNVHGFIDTEKYQTAHFLVVGPRESYVPAMGGEVFDPYIKCEVQKVIYENVIVNDEEVDDLRKEIYEVEYENLYPGMYGDGIGYGKVLEVEKPDYHIACGSI